MVINEVMTRDLKIASPSDSLQQAAQLMEQEDFGSLPVGENDRLVGMLSDRDIAIRAVAQGLSPTDCTVGDVMSSEVKYVFDDESIENAAKMMGKLQVRRLPVLNHDKRLVGIVSLGDLALSKAKPAGDALKSISKSPPS
jgi:CBS domain-containing protein